MCLGLSLGRWRREGGRLRVMAGVRGWKGGGRVRGGRAYVMEVVGVEMLGEVTGRG